MACTKAPRRWVYTSFLALVLTSCAFDNSRLAELEDDALDVEPDDGADLTRPDLRDVPDEPDTQFDFGFDLGEDAEDAPVDRPADVPDSDVLVDAGEDVLGDFDLPPDVLGDADAPPDAVDADAEVCPLVECTVGTGVCEVPGVWTCAPEGDFCAGEPGDPEPPLCDDEDDDCDDAIDEGVVAATTSLEIFTPSPPNRVVQSAEAVVVGGTVFAYLRVTAPGQQQGQLVRFKEDGSGLVQAALTHLCLATPQLAVSNGFIIAGCPTNLSGPILHVFNTDLTFLTSIPLTEPNDGQIREVQHLDLHLYVPLVAGDPVALPTGAVALLTYMNVLSSNSRVVLRRLTPDPANAGSFLQERFELEHTSAPAAVFDPGSEDGDASLILFSYYDFNTDEVVVLGLDGVTLDRLEDAGLDVEFRTDLPGLRCDGVPGRADSASLDGSVASLFAFSMGRGGENCSGITAANTQLLYRADLDGFVELASRTGSAGRVAGEPASGEGAWLVLDAGEGHFAFIESGGTLVREAALPDVVPFDDLVTTTSYFAVAGSVGRFLRWDELGCD